MKNEIVFQTEIGSRAYDIRKIEVEQQDIDNGWVMPLGVHYRVSYIALRNGAGYGPGQGLNERFDTFAAAETALHTFANKKGPYIPGGKYAAKHGLDKAAKAAAAPKPEPTPEPTADSAGWYLGAWGTLFTANATPKQMDLYGRDDVAWRVFGGVVEIKPEPTKPVGQPEAESPLVVSLRERAAQQENLRHKAEARLEAVKVEELAQRQLAQAHAHSLRTLQARVAELEAERDGLAFDLRAAKHELARVSK